jgi:Tfp pilus assembly protein PilF
MSSPALRRTLFVLLAVALIAAGVAGFKLWSQNQLPGPGSPRYEEFVDAFQIGLAALDAGVTQIAEENLTRAVEMVPGEPAGWADRGLHYLRTSRLNDAARDLEQARRLAPENAAVQRLIGLLEQQRGRYTEAAVYLRRAIEHDPDDVKTLYLLSQVIDQEHKEGSDEEQQRLLERILEFRPDNLRALADHLRVAVRRSDQEAVNRSLSQLQELEPKWSKMTREQFAKLQQKLAERLGPSAATSALRFATVLTAEPNFPREAAEISPPNDLVGDPLETFLRLAPMRPSPAAADTDLKFTSEPLSDAPEGKWRAAVPIWLTGEGEPEVFLIGDDDIRQCGGDVVLPSLANAADGVIPIDWNNDRRTDLFVAGEGGLRFYQQQEDGAFEDWTEKVGLPEDASKDNYQGALAADVDLDGDLDLIVARSEGSPVFLRNNFDGTFQPQPIFEDVEGPQQFVWADLDHDGAPDAALLGADGKLRVFANERSASFVAWPAAPPDAKLLAMTAADANDDGVLDLVATIADGRLLCIADRDKRSAWHTTELARWPVVPGDRPAGVDRLIAADFDNNGAIDLLAAGPYANSLWLSSGGSKFQQLDLDLPRGIHAAADLKGKGRLDLLAIDGDGRPSFLRNSGEKKYHWQTVRPQATLDKAEGDNRINSFGIGGEIELRTGTQIVKQPIAAPAVHFGLGERTRADVLRIGWPNGTFQAEFKTPIDQAVAAVQRLKGSCPFLFAFDGERMAFVSDFMWSTPLGMYINATDNSSGTGGPLQTTDWVKIPGDQLAEHDGQYELRVNANLWETHFFDQLALMVIDHADDTELFVDERFFMQPTGPAFHLMDMPKTVAAAWDHEGREALSEVSGVDGIYLDRCGRGAYQGLTRDHWVEVDLGNDPATEGPLWLVARGWVHPTDSSINYALAQGRNDSPRALVLETPDGSGGWKVARDRLGFPAGKNKTMLIRLDDLEGGVPRRLRLRTNMEIYWDWLAFARGRDDAPLKRRQLLPETADLRFRGIVAMSEANRSSPELPDYDRLICTGQYWRDLIGFHTRHGDIRELLETVDDHYAILTAGDEIVLKFAAPPAPPAGWKRDFLWVADGWVKDGDYNTRFGKSVLPLPAHDMNNYNTPPGELADDPVFRRHPEDWEVYHTRYITPYRYEQGLRPSRSGNKQ